MDPAPTPSQLDNLYGMITCSPYYDSCYELLMGGGRTQLITLNPKPQSQTLSSTTSTWVGGFATIRTPLNDDAREAPVRSAWDSMSMQEFVGSFQRQWFVHRRNLENDYGTHQHNLKAAGASLHVIGFSYFTEGLPSVVFVACGATEVRSHLSRMKGRTCPPAKSPSYRRKWTSTLRSMNAVVHQLHQAAPD